MKKLFAVLLSLIMAISTFALPNVSAFAAQTHVESAMQSIQKQSGYVPGKTAAVTGNCFGFVSAFCQKLYGVSYYYEQFNGSYRFTHTGNYKTVSSKTFSYPSTSSASTTTAKSVRDFILKYAAEGDVIQYGCANNSTTHMHTAIIQHLDSEKMQIFHSNYASGNYNAATCHIDTIYWSSFVSQPNTNIKDSKGNVKSLNKFFGAPMMCKNGLGLSLNRYTKLTSKYYIDMATLAAPSVSAKSTNSTSINFSWKDISGAAYYQYNLKDSKGNIIVNDSFTSNTSTLIPGLDTGEKYTFSVCASDGKEDGITTTKAVQCIPATPSISSVSASSSGMVIKWTAKSDVTGYKVFRATSSGGPYSTIVDINVNSKNSYTDDEIEVNKTYYYKVCSYVIDKGNTWYSYGSPYSSGKLTLSKPTDLQLIRSTSTAIRVKFSPVKNASSYTVSYKIDGGSWKSVKSKSCNVLISNLKMNKNYYFRVRAVNSIKTGSYCTSKKIKVLPPTPSSFKAKSVSGGVQLSWSKSSGFTGYYIVRATDKNFTKNVKKITYKNNSKTEYKDKTAKKGTTYYYKMCRYTGKTKGNYSKTVKIKRA